MTVLTVAPDARPARPRPAPGPSQSPGPVGPAGRRPRETGRDGPATRPGRDGRARSARITQLSPHRSASRSGTPDPHALARGFAHLYLEVECGRRPARQLAALMDLDLLARLEPVWVRLQQPLGRVRRVHATRSGSRIHAVVVVQRGSRAGALALELSRIEGRWYVTGAVRPEDGPLPPVPLWFLPPGVGTDLEEYDGGFDDDAWPAPQPTGEPEAAVRPPEAAPAR